MRWLASQGLRGFALVACVACSDGESGAEAEPMTQREPAPGAAAAPNDAAGAGGATSTGIDPSGASGAAPANGDAPGAATEGMDPLPLAPEPAVAGAADAGPGLAMPACERAATEANKAVVSAAIDELFVQGDIGAVDRYWGEPYLQHNPIAASGVAAFRNLFGGLVSPGNSIYELVRIIGECELVLIHGNYTSFGGPTFDLFRVREGRLVEHWDAAAVGAGPNASGHTALDGDAQVRDVALSDANEALVLEFVDEVLIGANYAAIGAYVSPNLVEHSPESRDGADAFVLHKQEQQISYRQVHHSIGDGNFVFVLSEGAAGATDVAHYDLFRVEGSRIVEHWDGRRPVPATTQSGLGIF